MYNNSNTVHQFIYGIMAFAEDSMDNSYAFASYSMSTPMFGSNAMENRQFGATVPNNRDRIEHLKQLCREKQERRRQFEQAGWIFCKHCSNQMPAQHMTGHLERKHNIRQGSIDDHARNAKRKHSVMNHDSNEAVDNDDNHAAMEQHVQKRARPNANSTEFEVRSPADAMIPRPVTPPSPPLIGNRFNAGSNANRQPSTSNAVCVQNKAYNVVYISDRELNKFMRNGRIEICNGRLAFKDSFDYEE